ncbi:MAG TPA: hypothetical protein PLR26_07840 [Bacilli bacterium]|nr:hypothetical protein [Bacilli bacterium]
MKPVIQQEIVDEVLTSIYDKPKLFTRIFTNIFVSFCSKNFRKKGNR